ncbi:hypothetical protein GCK72_017135 [Caenorhabditis remanei]|uniref:Uncharacterized protein n=1 Tax=Caenorhabditis remanei TaxID=31234 RepID=A0A6A5G7P1_CAERE|nr:hypothetical protein GCK72_017135 [Caenorhabditis remanei]KAF1750584.1 hypothetical protein GCK72_017135 [Caenorhabditis remanei]
MKILIPPKKEQPNLISTLFEEFLLEDSRKRSQQQILVSLVFLYRLLKLRRRIIAESQSDVEHGTEKQIVLEKRNESMLSYTEQLEKCVDFYSKEVFPLKKTARALSNHASLWGILCFSIIILNVSIFQFYFIIEALKQFNNESAIALHALADAFPMLLGTSLITAIGFIFVGAFLSKNEVAL